MLSPRYAEAVAYATEAHAGQVRKGTDIPYITHPIAVSSLVIEHGGDENQAIAALLHDAIEDCGKTVDEIAGLFGGRVAGIIEHCTDGVPDETGHKRPCPVSVGLRQAAQRACHWAGHGIDRAGGVRPVHRRVCRDEMVLLRARGCLCGTPGRVVSRRLRASGSARPRT